MYFLRINNFKIIFYLIIIYNFLLPLKVIAADQKGEYLVMGLGNMTCEGYLHEHDSGGVYYLSWVSGYISHYNLTTDKTYSVLGHKKTQDIEQWLYDYCTIHQQARFEKAVDGLVKKLHFTRHREKPKR